MLIFFVVAGIVGVANGEEGAEITLGVFGLVLVLEKLLTIHHAWRFVSEHMPKAQGIEPQPSAVA